MAGKSAQQALRDFLKAKVNSVSRERIFHDRLFFDLKIAAARHGYHLAVFEPEVDRDAFDVLLDDGDNDRRIQVKTVLGSSRTVDWYSTKRFMRPDAIYSERLNLPPADCGVGGGFLLIRIDDSTPNGNVSYAYTDYFIANALDLRLISERPAPQRKCRGRKKDPRSKVAANFLTTLAGGAATDKVRLSRSLFLRVKSPDCLLALMNLHSNTQCYLPADKMLRAIETRFEVDKNNDLPSDLDLATKREIQSHLEDIFELLDEPDLRLFNMAPLSNSQSIT